MRTRSTLALALVALLAALGGCSAEGSLSMDPVDDRGLAEKASHGLQVDAPPDHDRTVVRRAIENGSATTVGDRPPVDRQLPFRHEGRFYDVDYREHGTEPGYDIDIRVDYNASSVEGTVVDYEDLSPADTNALKSLFGRARPDADRLEPGYDFGLGVTYSEVEAESSVLAPTQEYDAVRYEGEVYPVDVDAEEETLTVYRYESTLVAESHEAYAESLRDRHEFELSGLSDAERGLVDESLDDTYWVEDDDNEAFDSLVDRFRTEEAVEESDYEGSYVVRYDGQLYWAEMDYGSYVEDS